MMRPVVAELLAPQDRTCALAYLAPLARDNLMLIDLVARCGEAPAPGEAPTEIALVRRAGELSGVAATRPSIVFDARFELDSIEAVLPLLEPLSVGLIKSEAAFVDALWDQLRRGGRRRALVDRGELAYMLDDLRAPSLQAPPGCCARRAREADLDALVYAARESLREEDRPDPFAGDAHGFRRWVRGRVERARVVECAGRIVFVGYADVQRPEGWLLQGIYTWPAVRRRGFAAFGMSEMCREAFARGASHVQLAVVDGNDAALGLYEGLGFKPFARLRTVLFA